MGAYTVKKQFHDSDNGNVNMKHKTLTNANLLLGENVTIYQFC